MFRFLARWISPRKVSPKARPRPTRRLWLEALEDRVTPAGNVTRFAVLGDFGANSKAEGKVATLVHNLNPDLIITMGDNNYELGGADTIDTNIGKYYHDYIYPYVNPDFIAAYGTGFLGNGGVGYGPGSPTGTNRFFPSLGNHDWGDRSEPFPAGADPLLAYFSLPGNERYYKFSHGVVDFFCLDSDSNEPDGRTSTSVQAQWLQAGLAASTAVWKIVYMHHAPYASGASHGMSPVMQWPFAAWGADAVLAGHEHEYERLEVDGIPYIVNGLGGGGSGTFGTPIPESLVRFNADYGAGYVVADENQITFQFIGAWDFPGQVIDEITLLANPAGQVPAVPGSPTVAATATQQLTLGWADNSTNETGFVIERSTDGTLFAPRTTVGANVTSYTDSGLTAGAQYFYRVRSANGAGQSAPTAAANDFARGPAVRLLVSAPATATTGNPLTAAVTAVDTFNRVAAGYAGVVQFSSSDGGAVLPANYTFGSADRGVHTFANGVTLQTAGTQTLTVADPNSPGIAAGYATIQVSPPPTVVRFAVIGEYGQASTAEQKVAALVHGWNPDFVITLGGNNAPSGSAATIDANVGQYYHDYIYPYHGAYGAGAAANKFWPALGHRDYAGVDGYAPYLDYFALPNNERYYDFAAGPVQLFALNSDANEPDRNWDTSTQGAWLQNRLAASTAPWKLVYFNGSPYSSTVPFPVMRWPFEQWGASAVLSAYARNYERLDVGGLPYFVNGLGGRGRDDFGTPIPESQFRFNGDYGAMLVTATAYQITFEFAGAWDFPGQVIDSLTLTVPPNGTPTNLLARSVSATQVDLAWTDQATNEAGYTIERSTNGVTFAPLATVGANVAAYSDTGLTTGTRYYYRVQATNAGGASAYSNVSSAVAGAVIIHLEIGAPVETTAGVQFTLTLSALDQSNNPVTDYARAVHFWTTDLLADLPANYIFSPADGGTHTFVVTLKTAGPQSIFVTDSTTGQPFTEAQLVVHPAAASTLAVANFPSTVIAGHPDTVTVVAKDPFGNTATGYRGTIHLTSSDGQALLPADYTFTAGDSGVRTFTVTLVTPGTHSLTATDTTTPSITGTQAGIVVNPDSTQSILIVNGLGDDTTADGVLTLREALAVVNGTLGRVLTAGEQAQVTGIRGTNDTIQFALPAGPQTITLTGGPLAILRPVFVQGPGAATLTISGDNRDRVLVVGRIFTRDLSLVAAVSGLTIAGGSAVVAGTNYGAGLLNFGTLTVSNVAFVGNAAGSSGGGAIYNVGALTVTNATFTGNSVAGGSGAAINNISSGTALVTSSTFQGNTATAGGSGGAVASSGQMTVSSSTFTGNSAASSGGAITNRGTGTLTVNGTTLADNVSGSDGGGIHNDGTLTVHSSTLANNTASSEGGGIDSAGTILEVTNSTIYGNSAGSRGGGINSAGAIQILSSTLTANRVVVGSGVGGGLRAVTPAKLFNTIVAGNFRGAAPGTTASDIAGATDATSAFNLIGTGGGGGLANGVNGNQVGVSAPGLGTLADNGGPTQTVALLSGSPAIDRGGNAHVTAIPTDQRGFLRIVNGTVDIGAFEAAGGGPPVP